MATTERSPLHRRMVRAAAASLLLATLFTSSLIASDKPRPYALIFGTVWGPGNVPLYGVKIKIRRANEKKAKWELYSNHRGEFAQRIPAGEADYVVWADTGNSGLESTDSAQVKVHIDNDERRDIGLHLIK